MKYASILTIAVATTFMVSCENKKNQEGTADPKLEGTLQVEQARFAADMAGVSLGKYVPVGEAKKAAPGETVYTKGSIMRKSVPAEGQDDVLIIIDPEKIKVKLVDGKPQQDGEISAAEMLDNTIIARIPQGTDDITALEEMDQVLISGTIEDPKTDKEPFKTIKVKSIVGSKKEAK